LVWRLSMVTLWISYKLQKSTSDETIGPNEEYPKFDVKLVRLARQWWSLFLCENGLAVFLSCCLALKLWTWSYH